MIKENESLVGKIDSDFVYTARLCIKNASLWYKPHYNQTSVYKGKGVSFTFKQFKTKIYHLYKSRTHKSILATSGPFPLILSYIFEIIQLV